MASLWPSPGCREPGRVGTGNRINHVLIRTNHVLIRINHFLIRINHFFIRPGHGQPMPEAMLGVRPPANPGPRADSQDPMDHAQHDQRPFPER